MDMELIFVFTRTWFERIPVHSICCSDLAVLSLHAFEEWSKSSLCLRGSDCFGLHRDHKCWTNDFTSLFSIKQWRARFTDTSIAIVFATGISASSQFDIRRIIEDVVRHSVVHPQCTCICHFICFMLFSQMNVYFCAATSPSIWMFSVVARGFHSRRNKRLQPTARWRRGDEWFVLWIWDWGRSRTRGWFLVSVPFVTEHVSVSTRSGVRQYITSSIFIFNDIEFVRITRVVPFEQYS